MWRKMLAVLPTVKYLNGNQTFRTMDDSYHGLFVPSLDFSYHGLFVPFSDFSYRRRNSTATNEDGI